MSIERNPISIRIFDEGLGLPSDDANVDVEVRDHRGNRWSATFYTIPNVRTLMERWRHSGEYGGGTYLWGGRDAILVERLSREVIESTVEQLRKEGEFERVFSALDDE